MLGMQIKGTKELEKYLKKISKLQRSDLNKIKVIGMADIDRHFIQGQAPTGKWRSLKIRRGKPLLDTGRLRSSIQGATEADSVEWGTNLKYARIHNEGGQAGRNKAVTIPERRFLWISNTAANRMVEVFIKRLEKS